MLIFSDDSIFFSSSLATLTSFKGSNQKPCLNLMVNQTSGLRSRERPHGSLEFALLLEEVHQVEVAVDGALSLFKYGAVASSRACEYALYAGLTVESTEVKESTG